MTRRLARDPRQAVFAGVAAGFAEYFDVDPVLVRLAFVLICLFGGAGLVLYVVAWVIMPTATAPGLREEGQAPADRLTAEAGAAGDRVVGEVRRAASGPGRGRTIVGVVLILLGALFLLDDIPWFYFPLHVHWHAIWPAILVAIGIAMIARSAGRRAP